MPTLKSYRSINFKMASIYTNPNFLLKIKSLLSER
jgi:hypothetical protein